MFALSISGHQLLIALENSVCQFPKQEGRFAQISGLTFLFDPELPPMQRIDPDSVKVHKRKWNEEMVWPT